MRGSAPPVDQIRTTIRMPIALVTGITGQDGSYLAEHLLRLGYEVHGASRDPEAAAGHPNLAGCAGRIRMHRLRLGDAGDVDRLLAIAPFDEIYHLAAQSHVGESYRDPVGTCDYNGLGTVRMLDGLARICPGARFFHAASSQVFGISDRSPQDESTPFNPTNPYGASKAFASQMVRVYRETRGIFAVNGICYNHESPRRGTEFVTGKICRAAAEIRKGRRDPLRLGDTRTSRDWGDARRFVEGFHSSLRAETATDYVFATGILHTVEDVLDLAFRAVGLDWHDWTTHDPALVRPSEPAPALGCPDKAARLLGWRNQTKFEDLIREMTLCHL